jgi:ppGpp synthetase/RelA/SpoT-type nucleotidyltranferase
MNKPKNYKDYLQADVDRTKEKIKNETDSTRIMIMTFHIKHIQSLIKKKRKGNQIIGGKVCDIVDKIV